jgi:hypothetical protein
MQPIWDTIFATLKTKDVLFAIPTQDVFAFANIYHVEAVKLLKTKTDEIFNNPSYPKTLSPNIYRRREGSNHVTIFNPLEGGI